MTEYNQGGFGNVSVDEIRELLSEYEEEINGYANKIDYFSLNEAFRKYIEFDNGEFLEYLTCKKERRGKKEIIKYSINESISILNNVIDEQKIICSEDIEYKNSINIKYILNPRLLITPLDFEEDKQEEKREIIFYLLERLKKEYPINYFDLKISIEIEKAKECIDFIKTSIAELNYDAETFDAFFRLGSMVQMIKILSDLGNKDTGEMSLLMKIEGERNINLRFADKNNNYVKAENMAKELWKTGDQRKRSAMAKYLVSKINEEEQIKYAQKNDGKELPSDKLISYSKLVENLRHIVKDYRAPKKKSSPSN